MQKLVLTSLLTFSLLLSGCAPTDARFIKIIEDKGYVVTVIEDPNLSRFKQGYPIRGLALMAPLTKYCTVILLEYPICLEHELKHCYEGSWHPRHEANDDFCY